MRIVAENWENNSNKIKELENRIIAKIWSIIISSLAGSQSIWQCLRMRTIDLATSAHAYKAVRRLACSRQPR